MASWVNDYLTIPYVDGGRDRTGMDCWGLVRDVLHAHFNAPLFTSFGHVSSKSKREMHRCYSDVVNHFTPCKPKAGCVVAGFHRGVLYHVGVCFMDGRTLKVLHTSSKHGPSVDRLRDFNRLFNEVIFYDCND